MAYKFLFATILATAHLAEGHYTFARIRHNGEWKAPYQYIRNKTAPFDEPPISANFWERGFHWETYYFDQMNSVRCGRGNMDWAEKTETLTVNAGDSFEIIIDAGNPNQFTGDFPPGQGYKFIHDGPVVVHLSAVPKGKSISEYDGSGRWVKIFTFGLEWREGENPPLIWKANNNGQLPPPITFKIPVQTPPGDYLMRMDQIYPGVDPFGATVFAPAQMYPSCAHIRVESNSTVSFPSDEGIRIPHNLDLYSPGMSYSDAMSRGQKVDAGWVYPGGFLWTGEEMVKDQPQI